MVIINYGVWERPGENIHLLLAQDFMCVRKHVLCPTFFFSLLTDAVPLGAKQRHVTNACTQQSYISTKPTSVCFRLIWMRSDNLSESRTSVSIFNR